MSVVDIDELLLTELSAGSGDATPETAGRSLSALIDALGTSGRRLSGQIELATALEDLRSDGLVEPVGTADEGTRYALTAAGRERAASVRDRLAAVPVTIVSGEPLELALSEAAETLERSLVELAAACTADGVYYRDDEPAPDRVVGREAERERCRSLFDAVRDSRRGRAAFLAGPGGVGKTTLAEDLAANAADEFEVLRAACRSENETFGPVRELLDGLEPSASPFDDVGAAVDDPEAFRVQQTALFHDVTAALSPEADERPRLLFLDDLHLADPATVTYLEYLTDRLADHPLVVLGTYRSTAVPDDAPFALESATDDESIAHVRLSPIDRDATRDLLEQVVGRRGAPADLVDAVYERTGGTPLFVEETVSRLLETDQLDARYEWYPETAAIDVSAAVTTTIERRIDDLDADVRHLLRRAAVVGERADARVLRTVCDLPGPRVETLLEALVSADVFDWSRDREAVTFRTAVVREALLADVDDGERRRRHGTIAAILEDVDEDSIDDDPGGERAATIADHYERAGRDGGAIDWYRRAGERATELYAHGDAVEHYRSALALARDGDDAATLLSVVERLTEIAVTTADFDEAAKYVSFARERSDDVERRQRLAVLSAKLANARGISRPSSNGRPMRSRWTRVPRRSAVGCSTSGREPSSNWPISRRSARRPGLSARRPPPSKIRFSRRERYCNSA